MRSILRKEKGVTLVSLVITIIVMLILVISVTASLSSTTEVKKYNQIKEDIVALTEEVKNYYLTNGSLPVVTSTSFTKANFNDNMIKNLNVNDGDQYYPIKTDLLSITLNKGEGNKNNNYTTSDLYIVNEKSLTVYYLAGATIDGKTYYTLTDDFSAGNYYEKVSLPLVASITIKSNNTTDTTIANVNNTVTLTMITNYELTTKPTVKIAGNTVTMNWDGKTGTATYKIPSNTTLTSGNVIPFTISGYKGNGISGATITEISDSFIFGDLVKYYK